MNPPTDCLSPIGEQAILAGLYKQIKGDFYTAVSRSPAVYRGNPFAIEVGLAYGTGQSGMTESAVEAEEAAPLVELAMANPVFRMRQHDPQPESQVEGSHRPAALQVDEVEPVRDGEGLDIRGRVVEVDLVVHELDAPTARGARTAERRRRRGPRSRPARSGFACPRASPSTRGRRAAARLGPTSDWRSRPPGAREAASARCSRAHAITPAARGAGRSRACRIA